MIDRLLDLAPKHPGGMTTDYRTVASFNYAVAPEILRRPRTRSGIAFGVGEEDWIENWLARHAELLRLR